MKNGGRGCFDSGQGLDVRLLTDQGELSAQEVVGTHWRRVWWGRFNRED